MITINIYQPNKIDANLSFPDSWNDLDTKELYFIAKTLLTQTEETAISTRATIIQFILEYRVRKAKVNLGVNFFNLFNPEELVIQVYPLIDFIFDKNELTNPPETVTFHLTKYIPQTFEELTCGEFEDCEAITSQFSEDPNPEKLAELAALLLRPRKGWRKDSPITPYMRYHAADDTYIIYNAAKKATHFKALPPERLYSILIYYAGCRAQLPKYFPDLYEGGKKNGKPDPMVFTQTIHSGAGPKNGTRNQIRTTKLYEFLYECNEETKKAKELQAEYNKQN